MKAILSALLLLAFSGDALAVVNAETVQKPQCFPEGDAGKDWPVRAVYLHGLFDPSGTGTYVQWEMTNRRYLEQLARRHRIRIAVPTSDTVIHSATYGRKRSWSSKGLKEIEAMASRACGGAKLDKPRVLIGFSNGGYKATAIAAAGCGARSDYSNIIAIGSPKANAAGCRNAKFTKVPVHKFPPANADDFFDDGLSSVSRASSSAGAGTVGADGRR